MSPFLPPVLLNILFWTSAVAVWHRPVVGTLEVHGHLAFPGGYSAVVLFELSVTRLPSDDGQSEGGSLPSTHSVFGTSEEVEVEVGVEVEDEAEEEFEEVEVESELEEVAECDRRKLCSFLPGTFFATRWVNLWVAARKKRRSTSHWSKISV